MTIRKIIKYEVYMVDSKYKVGDIIQFRSSQPMRHLNEMFCRGVDGEVVDAYIGVITDVSFFFMDGDSAVYTYDATTTRSPFEGIECSFNCILVDSDILRVLKEDEWTEAEHYCHRKYCQTESFKHSKSIFQAIRTIVVLSADNQDVLIQRLHNAYCYYSSVEGDEKVQMLVIVNMGLHFAMELCGRSGQKSFVFTEFSKDGIVHRVYYEMNNPNEKWHWNYNNYVITDESDEYEDRSDADDYYCFNGQKFKFSIPSSVFKKIDETMLENIREFCEKTYLTTKEGLQSQQETELCESIDKFLDFSINDYPQYSPSISYSKLSSSYI